VLLVAQWLELVSQMGQRPFVGRINKEYDDESASLYFSLLFWPLPAYVIMQKKEARQNRHFDNNDSER
jgi:hypothetical protein